MSIARNSIKKIFFVSLLLISILLIWINISLYADNFTEKEKVKDIQLQLNFLSKELKHNNLAKRMQDIFPEGFVFTNVLYGLSWCELGLADTSKVIKKKALKEALYAYNEINSEEAKSIFSKALIPENGIFYNGWNNYLLSKILLLDTTFANSKKIQNVYKQQCELITSSLKNSKSPFLESYQMQTWPADMCVAMASVSNYDKIYSPKYKSLISEWIEKVKSKLDPNTKLIPHKVESENGETIEGARGCSISLILRFMTEIDRDFAREQYKIYKEKFVSTTFGLPSINEYPKGKSGFGDIDSGPVIFGVGFAGTIVSIGTFSEFGESELSEKQYKTINSFGFSYKTEETKKYVFGLLPIADAFITWGRSSALNNTEKNIHYSKYWRVKFHIISILVIFIIWTLFYFRRILNKLKTTKKENLLKND